MSISITNPESRCFPAIDLTATGRNIEWLRIAAGYTVRELQRQLGLCSAQAIYRWQRGETLPSLDNMVILSRLFRASIEEILVCVLAAGGKEGDNDAE